MGQLQALGLTMGIEAMVAWGLARVFSRVFPRVFPRSERWALVAVVMAASLLTHPIAWQANEHWLRALPWWHRAAVIELGVVGIEAAVIRLGSSWTSPGALTWLRALVLSTACNAASFGYGLVHYGVFD